MTDNPIADFVRHDAENQRWLDSRPKCYACGEAIQEDSCLYDADGNKYHMERDCAEAWAETFVTDWTCTTMEQ